VGRCVGEGFFVGEGGTGFVGTSDVDERKGVGGGFDSGNIYFFEFFDVAENAAELCADFLLFFGS